MVFSRSTCLIQKQINVVIENETPFFSFAKKDKWFMKLTDLLVVFSFSYRVCSLRNLNLFVQVRHQKNANKTKHQFLGRARL